MILYNYKGKNKKGESVSGVIEARDEQAVADELIEKGIIPIKIRKQQEFIHVLDNLFNSKPVSIKEKVIFYREFSTMISAGLPIDDSIEVVLNQSTDQNFKHLLTDILKLIKTGSNLSDALSKYPKVFTSVEINLIRASEASGKLETVIARLADDVEQSSILQGKIKGALSYPIFVIVIAIAVVGLITIKLVPSMQSLYSGFGATSLPLPTEILVAISNFIQQFYYIVIIVFVIAYLIFRYYISTPDGKYVIDKLVLSIPIFGELLKKYQIVKFIKTYNMLIGAGLPIINALDLVSSSLGNEVYKGVIKDCVPQIEKGVTFARALGKSNSIPPILSRSIAVGEETGKTEQILDKIGSYYEYQVNDAVNNLTRLIEPILLVVLGGIVAFIAVSIYLPIYNFSNVIH